MTRQSLMLGEVCLDDFLSEKTGDDKKEEAKALLGELQRSEEFAAVQELPISKLRQQVASYDYNPIDLGFLRMSATVEHKGKEIIVPRFSVYNFGENERSFEMSLGCAGDYNLFPSKTALVSFSNNVNEIIRRAFLEGTEFYRSMTKSSSILVVGTGYLISGVPRKIMGKYDARHGNHTNLLSEFNSLIPKKTKEEIRRAKEYFNKNDIYFVRETKPEEWTITEGSRITLDPIVIGIIRDKAFLIDKFDATKLEDYVSKEFLG